MDRTTVVRLEQGARQVTLRDLYDIAAVLNVAPVHLLTPLEDEAPVEIAGRVLTARNARAWIRGRRLLRGADPAAFTRQLPDRELRGLVEAVLVQQTGAVTWALLDTEKREAAVRDLMDAIRNFTREEEDDGKS
jgi:transcriptional regulator with XRE-family HTH domain